MAAYKIGIAGTRGVPANYGGFETFAEAISKNLVEHGWEVTVYCDKNSYHSDFFQGVTLKFLPIRKSDNQVIYFFLSLVRALKENDLIVVTSTGGAYFYWLNFFFRKVIITNSDGIESQRSKWSYLKKKYLQYSQWFAMRFSTVVVADSFAIADYLRSQYIKSVPLEVIEYGAPVVAKIGTTDELVLNGLSPKEYFVIVARLEPENNIDLMLEAFVKSGVNKKCVVIGGLIDTKYVKGLKRFAGANVVFLGPVYNSDKLAQLRFHAFAYLHGHSVGGTNPSLLEAMGCGNICICHDNVFNREVTEGRQLYFSNVDELANVLIKLVQMSVLDQNRLKQHAIGRVSAYYSWENITSRYIDLFKRVLKD